ncbi:MAG: hypothetical protein M3539_09500 [Acidobacteriota bacterium]|nr:hypothetical protein [Acidobacteriota bacterium]
MTERLNTPARVEAANSKITDLFAAHPEWFFTLSGGNTESLARKELEIGVAHGRLILNCWTEKGSRSWKIFSCDWNGEKLTLQASRRMGAERPLIELVPRASANSIALTVKAARQARCLALAQLASSIQGGAKVERASLSPGARRGQPGRYARIVLRQRHQRIAVTGSVASSKASDADAFLAAALLWFKRTSERVRPPYIQQLWLIVESVLAKPVVQRVALLRQSLQHVIVVFEVDSPLAELTPVLVPTRNDLWKRRLSRFPPISDPQTSEVTERLIGLAPNVIDVVHARHGETLRYLGLPFARVRKVMGTERVWFGVEGSRRRMLDRTTENQWTSLFSDLVVHRSSEAADHHNALYRNAGEAWLESLLRRDITRLDPGLIIAPLYAQFRIARGGVSGVRPIDLLALRHDGRLAVIELKITEDREHVLQGADYWQRVEAHRRRGHITRAKLFGERKISNEPPLIYLVAPTLRVHASLNTLARTIAPDIEIYRFDINEDWRNGVRVMRRLRIN